MDREIGVSPLNFDWDLNFEHQPTILGMAYWNSRCLGRPMPSRADLDPIAMRKFSPNVGLVEVRNAAGGGTDYFIRRAGQRWEDVYGPMTGRLIQDFLPPHLVPSWREAFDLVTEAKTPVRLRTAIDFRGQTWLETEILIAPLGENDSVSMLFVCFVAWSKSNL